MTVTAFSHTTVLLHETVDLIDPQPGGLYCDATLGGGGHARAILERSGPDGRLIGFDHDPAALAAARETLAALSDRVTLHHASFAELPELLARDGLLGAVDGIVCDLGVSSPQLDQAERGFSLRQDGPLDMRMNPDAQTTAADLIETLSEQELADVLYRFGEERKSRRVARAIKAARARGELETTLQLAAVVAAALPSRGPQRIHPATRTFQALRIAVNDELGALAKLLERFIDVLRVGGRIAIISFHSLEDRAVKQRFAELSRATDAPAGVPIRAADYDPQLEVLTRGAVKASDDEIERNPRARSARLRAARRLR
ncbi:MAG: 16S rRNA (cytosine(1402)-N(4))-methyltransferase RsmH [Myxococcales bacterium]|nr:16S rRNA (cytosine(1402)-N(4))-methyltransferase RsmH [Myxococcales bacterium]